MRGDCIETANRFLSDIHKRAWFNPGRTPNPAGSSIIVTTDHVWIYRPTRGYDIKSCSVSFPRDTKEVLTIGSGGPYAHMAAKMGHGPVIACAMAGQHDYAAGQHINWIKLGTKVIKLSEFNLPLTNRIYD
jgi:hypothetical protein